MYRNNKIMDVQLTFPSPPCPMSFCTKGSTVWTGKAVVLRYPMKQSSYNISSVGSDL